MIESVQGVLGGSWAVISGVLSPLIWVISIATLLITPLITTHEPPSRVCRDLASEFAVHCLGDVKFRVLGLSHEPSTSTLSRKPAKGCRLYLY